MKPGELFKEITGIESIPETSVDVWKSYAHSKGSSRPEGRQYGSNVTIPRGSVFSHGYYSTDLEERLKK